MGDKIKYIKISDGSSCLIADLEFGLGEIEMIFEAMAIGEKWTFEVVEKTEQEFEELPEHSGW